MQFTPQQLQIIGSSPLFTGIEPAQLGALCDCLGCRIADYPKGAHIFLQGEIIENAGLLLQGRIRAESVNYDGVSCVVSKLGTGKLFGDALVSADGMESPVSVYAETDCRVLLIPGKNMMSGCEKSCESHITLRRNLQKEIAEKFWQLNRKIAYLSARTLRGKITEFLYDCSCRQKGARTFTVALSREQLASLLGANRSALCRELTRMQQEGLLNFHKSSFVILNLF